MGSRASDMMRLSNNLQVFIKLESLSQASLSLLLLPSIGQWGPGKLPLRIIKNCLTLWEQGTLAGKLLSPSSAQYWPVGSR